MKSPITNAFALAREQGRAAFIPYMTAGYPDRESFLEIMETLDRSGADVIEIGLPFSDPLADGPVIQASGTEALAQGVTTDTVFELAAEVRRKSSRPLVIMTYYNPVLKLGPDNFARRMEEAGVAGIIIPDLPVEESDPWLEAASRRNLDTIFMVAPTTTPERLQATLAKAGGFVYYVSFTGVTGAKLSASPELLGKIGQVRSRTNVPVAVGFGVSTPEQAAALAGAADGVIVGSALIKAAMNASDPKARVRAVDELARSIGSALRNGNPAGSRTANG